MLVVRSTAHYQGYVGHRIKIHVRGRQSTSRGDISKNKVLVWKVLSVLRMWSLEACTFVVSVLAEWTMFASLLLVSDNDHLSIVLSPLVTCQMIDQICSIKNKN